MSFGWLGTFRQGQWRAFRTFVLHERRDIANRLAVIDAELKRIGRVRIMYERLSDADGNETVTEKRTGIQVSSGSSLEKLFQAYIAVGGNPFDISLFLTPDAVLVWDNQDGEETTKSTQPYQGVVYPKDGVYSTGNQYEGGHLVLKKYTPNRTGNSVDDSRPGAIVDQARRWVNQIIRERRHDLEARIIKLCDLREQLIHEQEELVLAAVGTVAAIPAGDADQYEEQFNVAKLIAQIDAVFYEVDEDGTADFTTTNAEMFNQYPTLMADIPGEEDNTAL